MSDISGSQYLLRELINSPKRYVFEEEIGCGMIKWLSPLTKEDYYEYELGKPSADGICRALGLPESSSAFWDFWPRQGKNPMWDAIGLSNNGKTIILVEAKSYTGEMSSSLRSTDEGNRELISTAMGDVFSYYNGQDFNIWTEKYYQLANRLTFLHKLNSIEAQTGKRVRLVLLNFTNNPANLTSSTEWDNHYCEVFKEIIGSTVTPQDVMLINHPMPESSRKTFLQRMPKWFLPVIIAVIAVAIIIVAIVAGIGVGGVSQEEKLALQAVKVIQSGLPDPSYIVLDNPVPVLNFNKSPLESPVIHTGIRAIVLVDLDFIVVFHRTGTIDSYSRFFGSEYESALFDYYYEILDRYWSDTFGELVEPKKIEKFI